jgi:hypothetical protein
VRLRVTCSLTITAAETLTAACVCSCASLLTTTHNVNTNVLDRGLGEAGDMTVTVFLLLSEPPGAAAANPLNSRGPFMDPGGVIVVLVLKPTGSVHSHPHAQPPPQVPV